MNDELTTRWECPKCGYESRQPKQVSAVAHLCGLGKRSTDLKRQPDGWELI